MTKVVRFTASWCGPCKVLAPIFNELAADFASRATFETIDIDEDPEYTAANRVTSVPQIIIFKDEKESQRYIGVKPKATYIANFNAIL
jgi:thioredoxin 1